MVANSARMTLETLQEAWSPYRDTSRPPPKPVLLGQVGTRTIYLNNEWGPPIPYPPALHEDGTENHGYTRLKGSGASIALIPEVRGWPEYQAFLEAINGDASPIESVGCEKAYFPKHDGVVRVYLGSYTDIMFSERALNNDATNSLRLASQLAASLEGCERWWSSAEFAIQRMKWISGCTCPWGLMVKVGGRGRDEAEARRTWSASMDRLTECIRHLPADWSQ